MRARADDRGEIRRERDFLHHADLDVLVFDLGLPGLEPARRLERDRDLRAPLGEGAIGDEGAHQGRHQRDQPDDRDPAALLHHGFGDAFEIPGARSSFAHACLASLRSQIRRGSNASAASIVLTTTAPKNTAPGPAWIVARLPSRTSATRIEIDEDVDHRPAADRLGDAIHAGSLHRSPARTPLYRDQQEDQDHQLEHRHEDARREHDHCQRPHAMRQKVDDATHDGVGLNLPERRHLHHGQHVGRDVAERGRDHERPGALEAARLAHVELGAAARAARAVGAMAGQAREQAAVVAARATGGERRARSGGAHRRRSSRSHTASGSKEATAPVSTSISSTNDHSASPGTMVAMPISFTSATRIPIMKTSIMLHGCT